MKYKILISVLIVMLGAVVGAGGIMLYDMRQQSLLQQQEAQMHQAMMGQGNMSSGSMGQGMMGQGMMADSPAAPNHAWTAEEIEVLRSLWIGSLPPLPPDPSNQYADNPQAAALGQALFFDTRFSSNGQVACATCHIPELMFTDGRALAVGVGVASRKTMTIVGAAYSPWQFWDGRADSQWAQALGPLENPVEHGGTRTQYAHLIARYYPAEYEAIFGPLPDLSDPARFPASAGPVADPAVHAAWDGMTPVDRDTVNRIYANIGKAIAAYERLIVPGPSRFDTYVEALLAGDTAAMEQAMTADEVAGLRLFIGAANCIQCHNGPLFTDNAFHNTGVPPRSDQAPDPGRQAGIERLLKDEFNCLGAYSDADPGQCLDLQALAGSADQLAGAFKPPTLRNVAQTGPYMHAGQYGDLFSVVRHYRHPPTAAVGTSELEMPMFMHNGMLQLQAFLASLSGPLATPPELLTFPPAAVPITH